MTYNVFGGTLSLTQSINLFFCLMGYISNFLIHKHTDQNNSYSPAGSCSDLCFRACIILSSVSLSLRQFSCFFFFQLMRV